MHLYRTSVGAVLSHDGRTYAIGRDWGSLVNDAGLPGFLAAQTASSASDDSLAEHVLHPLPPLERQEVWAAGVTYFRSRDARMEESQEAGGGDFYSRVYDAPRPELFFKASPSRVAGPGAPVRNRRDSKWNVPEPELALWISSEGTIEGFTIGNDMSSRDIEGENPLYLPQAKVYDACCGLGPGLLVAVGPLSPTTAIRIEIGRASSVVFAGQTTLAQLKRTPEELAGWLFRDQVFPDGCFLLTGTGIVPDPGFTLEAGDEVRIEIDGIGRLVNPVVQGPA
jgi:2-dehydro-3-deoxy-D-arabinonate dehydratase